MAEDGPEGLRGGDGGGREGGVGARGGGDDVPRGAGGPKLPQMAKLGEAAPGLPTVRRGFTGWSGRSDYSVTG